MRNKEEEYWLNKFPNPLSTEIRNKILSDSLYHFRGHIKYKSYSNFLKCSFNWATNELQRDDSVWIEYNKWNEIHNLLLLIEKLK